MGTGGELTAMTDPDRGKNRRRGLWVAALVLIAVAVFMYVSIMYKIVNFGA